MSPKRQSGSRPISRVLSGTVIHLGCASPHTSRDLPGSRAGRTTLPYLVLLRVGFTLPPLLPAARCALTAPFHPYPVARKPPGGTFSAALSVAAPSPARPPGVTWHPALWSPDFPPAACTASGCLTDPGRILAETVNSEQLIVNSSRVGPGCRGGRARAHCVSANLRC